MNMPGVFNDKESIGKQDSRGEPGTLLGYAKNTKSYKVLVKRNIVVIESMNVIFDAILS